MSTIKHWNVCTRKTYKRGDEDKAYWPNVGQLTYFPARGENKAGFKLELNMHPDTQFYIFEQVERENPKVHKEEVKEPEIDSSEIPY